MSFRERKLEQHIDFEDISFRFSRNQRILPETMIEKCVSGYCPTFIPGSYEITLNCVQTFHFNLETYLG